MTLKKLMFFIYFFKWFLLIIYRNSDLGLFLGFVLMAFTSLKYTYFQSDLNLFTLTKIYVIIYAYLLKEVTSYAKRYTIRATSK